MQVGKFLRRKNTFRDECATVVKTLRLAYNHLMPKVSTLLVEFVASLRRKALAKKLQDGGGGGQKGNGLKKVKLLSRWKSNSSFNSLRQNSNRSLKRSTSSNDSIGLMDRQVCTNFYWVSIHGCKQSHFHFPISYLEHTPPIL